MMVSRNKSTASQSAGEALVARILNDMAANGLEPDGREVELLDQARHLTDRIADLERALAEDGLRTTLASGRMVPHPFIAEIRQTRAALTRVLAGVQLEESVKNPVKQKAAQTKWRAHNEAKKRVYGG